MENVALGIQMMNTKLALSALQMEMVWNALLYVGDSR